MTRRAEVEAIVGPAAAFCSAEDDLAIAADKQMAGQATMDPFAQLAEIVSRLNDLADFIDERGSYSNASFLRATAKRCSYATEALRARLRAARAGDERA